MASHIRNGRDQYGSGQAPRGSHMRTPQSAQNPYANASYSNRVYAPDSLENDASATNRYQRYLNGIDYDYVNQGWPSSRVALFVALVVVGALVLFAFDLYCSTRSVLFEMNVALAAVDDIKGSLKHGDSNGLHTAVNDLVGVTHDLRNEVHSPAWFLLSITPYFGSDVRSVQALVDISIDLAENALVPMADNPDILNSKDVFKDDAIDLDALESLSDSLESVAPVFLRDVDRVQALPKAHTHELDVALASIKDGLGSTTGMIELAQSLIPHLDKLLGGAGSSRNYLIVAYTNAELRAGGGFPGSWTLVTVDQGKIEMGKTVTIQLKPDNFIAFREDELKTFSGLTGNMGAVPLLPDYRKYAPYMAQGYQYHRGVHIDGVIAIDPVFLQRLLTLTGGVVASDGTKVDGTNAAWELMSNAYWRFGNAGSKQDRFFGEVAALSFNKLMHGLDDVSLTDLYSTLSSSATDHRLQMWFEDEDLQRDFARQGFSGEIPDDPAKPELGIYLNDSTWAKIGWYAKLDTYVSHPRRNSDGSSTYEVTTTVTNSAWSDELLYAPRYVWGYNQNLKTSNSDMVISPLFVAPAGGKITDMTCNEEPWDHEHSLYGYDVYYDAVHADVGQSVVFRYKVTTAPEAQERLTVRKTPLAQERLLSIDYAWGE